MTQLDIFTDESTTVRSFEQEAYGYLLAYARRMGSRPFGAEEVTLSALEAGVIPRKDLRDWGPIFLLAAKEGHIRRADAWFRRTRGKDAEARCWIGV